MGFQQGLSGLNASSKNLDVIGNNVANSTTVGFKVGQAQFADVFAASLTGAGTSPVGLGAKLSAIAQQFTQGNITSTNNPLDLAINGGGFFLVRDTGGTPYYSRNGQFQLDKSGYIVNNQGMRLAGYPADSSGTIIPGSQTDIKVSTTDISPIATGASSGGTGVQTNMNLDGREAVNAIAFNPSNPLSYNQSTALNVYDSQGNAHTLTMYFDKVAAGQWAVYTTVTPPGGSVTNVTPAATATAGAVVGTGNGTATVTSSTNGYGGNFSVQFTSPTAFNVLDASSNVITSGALADTVAGTSVNVTAQGVNFTITNGATAFAAADTIGFTMTGGPRIVGFNSAGQIDVTNSLGITAPGYFDQTISAATLGTGAGAMTFKVDFTGSTQFGSKFSVNSMVQDGYASGKLTGFTISPDGVLLGRYSNGQSQNLAQVVLANFRNPQGLSPQGNNLWVESSASGAALIGSPQNGQFGAIQSSAVEDSNVDLTAELVNMITAQRVYQANAQTIKTQDQVLQTLVNLR